MEMNVFIKPKIASAYDDYYQSDFGEKIDALEKDIIRDLMNEIPKGTLLDLGCGTGHWSAHFVSEGFEVTGLDISDAMLDIARKKNIEATFVKADARALPFPDKSFDVITAITMLEFVDNRNAVIGEIYRVLKKGGWLVLGCLNARSVIGINKEHDETFRHAQLLTEVEVREMLKSFGTPQLSSGVYIKKGLTIIENPIMTEGIEPAFIGGVAQKTKS